MKMSTEEITDMMKSYRTQPRIPLWVKAKSLAKAISALMEYQPDYWGAFYAMPLAERLFVCLYDMFGCIHPAETVAQVKKRRDKMLKEFTYPKGKYSISDKDYIDAHCSPEDQNRAKGYADAISAMMSPDADKDVAERAIELAYELYHLVNFLSLSEFDFPHIEVGEHNVNGKLFA